MKLRASNKENVALQKRLNGQRDTLNHYIKANNELVDDMEKLRQWRYFASRDQIGTRWHVGIDLEASLFTIDHDHSELLRYIAERMAAHLYHEIRSSMKGAA